MKFRIDVDLNVSCEDFWKYRSHSKLLSYQVERGGLDRIETIEEGVLESGTHFRRMHIFPKMEFLELSKTIKHIVEQKFTGLHDYQWWEEDGSLIQCFETRPLGFLAHHVLTEGKMELTRISDTICRYSLTGSVDVHFLGLGPIVEAAVVHNMKKFYKGGFRDSVNEFFQRTFLGGEEFSALDCNNTIQSMTPKTIRSCEDV
ncbi:hypothetical protein Gasu2_35030 [Galdieria sulphuraria]|uniref:PRELI/MSF1 domain-containing protein n=1 Tax=Galdieria sulphuraria TaxID=130081 RepID=M2WU22_GALSU|nr:uncharacterized protein Gasu_50020 [Galdieria sulphuraria]EME27405.1 hypothetical protein Gasu_50020 [Galdieria sulphuraria]GJD09241.1 hypothetical protein Gasu2_35030 [Galdieria sulphuraria]|eukprot:XP_005703925.1 hypothetical protein Gasu_50020 [Galdieria sulphuraria]